MPLITIDGVAPTVGPDCFIAAGAMVSGRVTLGARTSVWYNCVLRGDVEPLVFGEDCNLQDGAIFHGTSGLAGVTMGDRVSVGHNAVVHGARIGNDVLVGMSATVLDGSVVEDHVFIAAGSLVVPRSHLVSGFLYAGSPAVQKRPLSDRERLIIEGTWRTYGESAKQHRAALIAGGLI